MGGRGGGIGRIEGGENQQESPEQKAELPIDNPKATADATRERLQAMFDAKRRGREQATQPQGEAFASRSDNLDYSKIKTPPAAEGEVRSKSEGLDYSKIKTPPAAEGGKEKGLETSKQPNVAEALWSYKQSLEAKGFKITDNSIQLPDGKNLVFDENTKAIHVGMEKRPNGNLIVSAENKDGTANKLTIGPNGVHLDGKYLGPSDKGQDKVAETQKQPDVAEALGSYKQILENKGFVITKDNIRLPDWTDLQFDANTKAINVAMEKRPNGNLIVNVENKSGPPNLLTIGPNGVNVDGQYVGPSSKPVYR